LKKVKFQISTFSSFRDADRQIIASFGTARLVRKSDGRHELIGGTVDDHAAAREWCSLFAPEVVFASVPLPAASLSFAA
jgi:hypothetical protein